MKIVPRTHATTTLRKRIIWICVSTLVLSLGFLIVVLWFQQSAFGSNAWDFQGATGAATVIPSFAGVALAGWAVYFQIKTSSPSYKAAEQSWLDISELYHRALKVGALLNYDADYEVLVEAPMPHDDSNVRTRIARGLSLARCAKEFEVDKSPESFRTLATLALGVFPVLESLQGKLDGVAPVDFIELEAKIDIVGATYDANAEDQGCEFWIRSANSVLRSLVDLIEALQSKTGLSIDVIEDALLNPGLSKTIRHWFEQQKDLAEWRRIRGVVDYTRRG